MGDQQNPFTMAGMMQMMMPNKYIDAAYKNKSLPIPGYLGTPADAQGNPIQSFTDAQKTHDAWDAAHPAPTQGMTLNTNPSGYVNPAVRAGANADMLQAMSSMMPTGGGNYAAGPGTPKGFWEAGGDAGQQQRQAAPQAAPQNPIDMRQAYLTALSNPGKVTTPGATIQPSAPLGQPNVLDAFMANHQAGPAAPAGGGYSNKPFFDTLSQLRNS